MKVDSSKNITITPLIICTNECSKFLLKENCKCSICLNLSQVNKISSCCCCKSEKVVRSSTPVLNQEEKVSEKIQSRQIGTYEEPIIYIDSIDHDETGLSSSAAINMNQLISKLKHQTTSTLNCCCCNKNEKEKFIFDTENLIKLLKKKVNINNNTNRPNQAHDYHVIDEEGSKHLSPSNSVESFEFVSPSCFKERLNTENSDASYEKSWESTILMEKLNDNSQVNVTPVDISGCILREKKSNRSFHLTKNHRVSFPFQKNLPERATVAKITQHRPVPPPNYMLSNSDQKQTSSHSNVPNSYSLSNIACQSEIKSAKKITRFLFKFIQSPRFNSILVLT